ncbi:Regulator of G-protein signaling 5 [Apodemus speciosus]|uniref:Regulator of G-protein signaling 5 n=1 Tax=Apodemus speciosus TaxID=105296 RepID=A0ABQ0EFF2_APOSI
MAKEIKIKLGILLQKPDSAVDLVIPYNEKPEKPVKAHKGPHWRRSCSGANLWTSFSRAAVGNIGSTGVPQKVLQHQHHQPGEAECDKLPAYGFASFKSFLKSEFSEENLEFWAACENYKKIKSPIKMAEKAKQIYEEFIQTEAPKEVNIDHFTKDITMKNLVEPSPRSFDLAQKRIYALMEKDSLPRFVRSEFYKELIK